MKDTKILITGGAGYIGSHLVKLLNQAQEKIIILDNLTTGFKENINPTQLIIGNAGDKALVTRILTEHHIETVIHLAASTSVPISIKDPLAYYKNNVCNMVNLLECCTQNSTVKNFIFSSTAAVYGNPMSDLIDESHPCNPTNPYGQSKLMGEQILIDAAKTTDLRYVILRYFNVAGASMDGNLGDRRKNIEMLIPTTVQTALNKKPKLQVYGNDYPTPDGTAIRDYIHVEDISSAHIAALKYLSSNNKSVILNCGYGRGYSINTVINVTEKLIGKKIPTDYNDRRPGDCAAVIANAKKINDLLHWQPQYNSIENIIQSVITWEIKNS